MTRGLVAASLWLCATGLAGQDAGPVLDRAARTYDTTRSLAADFTQIITNPLIGAPDTTRGALRQLRPNFFEMRFVVPQGDRIVADGRFLWLYTPSTTPGQVIRSAIPSAGTTGPNLIGQFVDHARERYALHYLRADTLPDGPADVIALDPRASDLPYRRAVLWVSRADATVRRLDITEQSGQERTIILRTIRVNAPVSAGEFRFSVPRGVRVVEQ